MIYNINALVWMIALGLQQAACCNIGHQIGKNDTKEAKSYLKICNLVAFSFIFTACSLYYTFKNHLINVFTKDVGVQHQFDQVVLPAVLSLMPGMWQGYLQGVVKALGMQSYYVFLSFTAWWLLNMPLSVCLTFHLGYGFPGVWISTLTAEAFLAVSNSTLIWVTDWERASEKSKERQSVEIV